MTQSLLLILLSLCTLIYSDSLSHFQEVDTNDITDVNLRDIKNKLLVHIFRSENDKTPSDSLFNGSVESCAKLCLLAKFYCQSFMVMSFDDRRECIMDHNGLGNFESYFEEGDGRLEAAYENVSHLHVPGLCSRSNIKTDNVATISKDPTLLREDRFKDLLEGYGISKLLVDDYDDLVAFLEGCTAALDVPESKQTSFRDWFTRILTPTSERQSVLGSTNELSNFGNWLCTVISSKITRLNKLRGYPNMPQVGSWRDILFSPDFEPVPMSPSTLIPQLRKWLNGLLSRISPLPSLPGSTSRYSSNYEPFSKRRRIDSNSSGLDLLAFLDLFSRGVDPRTKTIYSPEEGTLYIESPDIQLLIFVYQDGDYLYAVSGNKVASDSIYELSGNKVSSDTIRIDGSWGKVQGKLETIEFSFATAAHRIIRDLEGNIYLPYKGFDSLIWRFVSFLIGSNKEYEHKYHDLLCNDLLKVVSIIRKERPRMFSQGRNSFPYEDVKVITSTE